MRKETMNIIRGKIGLKADCILETDDERRVVWDALDALEKQTPKKPMLKDHDHDEYFSMSVECGECGAMLGSWDYGRAYCNGSKEWFIENHRFCNRCGQKIDWSENND